MSDDLVTWLRAQLDEDERDAREAITWEDDRFTGHSYTWMLMAYLHGKMKRQHVIPGAPSPHRVLAEVDAKRRIIDLLDRAVDYPPYREEYVSATALDDTVKLLALPYADRPGYREEWRPDAPA